MVGRVRGEKSIYNQLEDVHGRLSVLHAGDVIAGTLGHRNALRGYEGVMPSEVKVGDHLHLLNMGGVIGKAISSSPDVGAPFEVKMLGQVLLFPEFGTRIGAPASISRRRNRGTCEFAAGAGRFRYRHLHAIRQNPRRVCVGTPLFTGRI